jgi:SAM-dependent methyltransferase
MEAGTVSRAAAAWDAEYAAGRYQGEAPVAFVEDVLKAAAEQGPERTRGVDVGSGNGRNLRSFLAAGIDMIGLDISQVAIDQLREEMPERAESLICGDISALPSGMRFGLVVAIQVFQHGDRAGAHAEVRRAQDIVEPGGLLAVRVNSVQTDLWPEHEIVQEHVASEGLTLKYLAGPKEGLLIHFFDEAELAGLFAEEFQVVLPPRVMSQPRQAPKPGQWSQIEAIWRRP